MRLRGGILSAMTTIYPAVEFKTERRHLALDGLWAFSYDPDNVGVSEGWFAEGKVLPEETIVPGCSQARHYDSSRGNERVTDVDIPEQSRTIMLKHGSMHPSWYQRRFTLPADWQGQQVHLHVGGVKPAAEFWLNGEALGETLTSRTPVRCDLTPHLHFGEENTLTVRLHWPRFHLDGVYDVWHAWSGFYRNIRLEVVPAISLADIHVSPVIKPTAATVEIALRGETNGKDLRIACDIVDQAGNQQYYGETRVADTTTVMTIPMPGAQLWSPHAPNLYHARVRVYDGDELVDAGRLRFGLREISYKGFQVLLNGTSVKSAGYVYLEPNTAWTVQSGGTTPNP